MQKIILNVAENSVGERLDKFIADNADKISRSYAAKLCEDGAVKSGDTVLSKKYKIKGGESIEISVPDPTEPEAIPENIPLDIVYEDDDVIIINKPQGMVVHPAAGNETGTLVNGLLYHCELSAINGVIRPGIVHRIDKDTSGLLIAAKNNEAHLALAEQWKDQKPLRKYIALVNGNIKEDEGTINKPIARHPNDRKKMAVVYGGREAITHYKVLKRYGQYTLVECILETGRTHQIRVHMASIGHSIVGDKVYGIKKEKFKLDGQLLHAQTIGFIHPRTGEKMEFSSEIPEYFQNILKKIER
jgi:23S rRNA pseudouridine1911/1915/1917 synthase